MSGHEPDLDDASDAGSERAPVAGWRDAGGFDADADAVEVEVDDRHGEEYRSGLDSRRELRERILALLYESEAKALPTGEVLAGLPLDPDPWVAEIVAGVGDRRDEIDALLRANARNWSLERMPTIDRSVLRFAVYELLACPETPVAVVLNEAVALVKHYSTEDSGKFVNGLLSAIAAKVR